MKNVNLKNETPTFGNVAVRCNLSKDEEIALYEIFLDEFTDKEGLMEPCSPI